MSLLSHVLIACCWCVTIGGNTPMRLHISWDIDCIQPLHKILPPHVEVNLWYYIYLGSSINATTLQGLSFCVTFAATSLSHHLHIRGMLHATIKHDTLLPSREFNVTIFLREIQVISPTYAFVGKIPCITFVILYY